MKLSREVSHNLVKELIVCLGEQRTQKILSVDDVRFRFLANGHGCVSYEQLGRIDRQSGRAWQRWIVDAGGGYAKTAKARAFVARAHEMWDRILGPEKNSAARASGRRSKTLPRQAV
jgi:hypothetical protein